MPETGERRGWRNVLQWVQSVVWGDQELWRLDAFNITEPWRIIHHG